MKQLPLLTAFQRFIKENQLIHAGDSLIVAVSGGVDSMALLDLLATVQEPMSLRLGVAHFDFRLRGEESEQDEEFVRAQAQSHGFDCYIRRADTAHVAAEQKRSIQEVARDLRYQFFDELRQSLGFGNIATAHHADDNAETILLNIIRGTGVAGLSGIPLRRKDLNLVRPLLFATRQQIQAYASERNLAFREDSSNAANDYSRNFLRHKIIPLLQKEINLNLSLTLLRTGAIYEQLEQYLNRTADKLSETAVQ